MGKIFLVCPNCKTRLSCPEVPGYQDKIVTCPICQFKAKANVYQSGALGQGGQGSDDEAKHSLQIFQKDGRISINRFTLMLLNMR